MEEEIIYDSTVGEYTEEHRVDHILIKRIYHKPIILKPDEAIRLEYEGKKLISTKVIKEKDMATCQIVLSVNAQHLQNKEIKTNATKLFICNEEYVQASDFLTQTEQLLTDILAYYSEYSEWPTVQILPHENTNDKS
jgi:hypothetical protein